MKLILNLCMNYMVHVSSIMWRIKNQPSNSTSCGDNALRLLVLVVAVLYWGLQVTSSFSIWGCVLKGCFVRGVFLKGQVVFEEYWRLQSWTLTTNDQGQDRIIQNRCSRFVQIAVLALTTDLHLLVWLNRTASRDIEHLIEDVKAL